MPESENKIDILAAMDQMIAALPATAKRRHKYRFFISPAMAKLYRSIRKGPYRGYKLTEDAKIAADTMYLM